MKYVIAYKHERTGNLVYWSGKFEAVGANMSVMIRQTALLHEAYICDTRAEALEKLSDLVVGEDHLRYLNHGETWLTKEITDKELFDARLKGT